MSKMRTSALENKTKTLNSAAVTSASFLAPALLLLVSSSSAPNVKSSNATMTTVYAAVYEWVNWGFRFDGDLPYVLHDENYLQWCSRLP